MSFVGFVIRHESHMLQIGLLTGPEGIQFAFNFFVFVLKHLIFLLLYLLLLFHGVKFFHETFCVQLTVVEALLETLSLLEAHFGLFYLLLEPAFGLSLRHVQTGIQDALKCSPLLFHQLLVVRVHQEQFILSDVCCEGNMIWTSTRAGRRLLPLLGCCYRRLPARDVVVLLFRSVVGEV